MMKMVCATINFPALLNAMMKLPLGQFIFNLIGLLVICCNYWLLGVDKQVDMPVSEEDASYTQMLMYVFFGLASFIGGGRLYFNG